jgi:DnaK suppressor protein
VAKKKKTRSAPKLVVKKKAKPPERKASPRPVIVTPAKTSPKPKAAKPIVASTVADPVKAVKSPLGRKELNDFRKLLMAKRGEILGDMRSMSHEALNADSANLSHMPIHMADVGTDNYEQELTLGLVESERVLLGEIDEAIKRIDEGIFGVCQSTGKPIGKARLAAKPWAKYSIEAMREMERGGRRF